MANVKIKQTPTVTLTLSIEEALFIKRTTQNTNCVNPLNEDQKDKHVRVNIFTALPEFDFLYANLD